MSQEYLLCRATVTHRCHRLTDTESVAGPTKPWEYLAKALDWMICAQQRM
jgi:hypothetical protein